jgi:hypothetical protein
LEVFNANQLGPHSNSNLTSTYTLSSVTLSSVTLSSVTLSSVTLRRQCALPFLDLPVFFEDVRNSDPC